MANKGWNFVFDRDFETMERNEDLNEILATVDAMVPVLFFMFTKWEKAMQFCLIRYVRYTPLKI